MTPLELLEEVKSRFNPLLHDDDDKLQKLLLQALRKYQERAGHLVKLPIKAVSDYIIPLPDDFLALVSVTDKTGDVLLADAYDTGILLDEDQHMYYPLSISYMASLTTIDLEKGTVPPAVIGAVADYLEALIDIPNTHIQRTIMLAGKLDASDLPDRATLLQRATDMENAMSSSRAILPAFTVFAGG